MPVSDYTPTVEEVAALMHSRTMGDAESGGTDQGTFNEHTNPTGDEVETLIGQAAQVVALDVGAALGEAYWDVAKLVISLLTAAWIERAYQPEQATETQTPYRQYMDEYESLLRKLLAAVPGDTAETTGGLISIPMVSPLAALAAAEDDE